MQSPYRSRYRPYRRRQKEPDNDLLKTIQQISKIRGICPPHTNCRTCQLCRNALSDTTINAGLRNSLGLHRFIKKQNNIKLKPLIGGRVTPPISKIPYVRLGRKINVKRLNMTVDVEEQRKKLEEEHEKQMEELKTVAAKKGIAIQTPPTPREPAKEEKEDEPVKEENPTITQIVEEATQTIGKTESKNISKTEVRTDFEKYGELFEAKKTIQTKIEALKIKYNILDDEINKIFKKYS